jgi:predicted RNA-binding Zn-ribbon protein involved in translation (DUF1610 family)
VSDFIDPDGEIKPRSRLNGATMNGASQNGRSHLQSSSGPKTQPQNPASGRIRKGKCPNAGECSNGGTYVDVPEGASFVCPECGSDLLPERAKRLISRQQRVLLLGIAGCIACLGLAGLGIHWAVNRSSGTGTASHATGSSATISSEPPPPPERKPTLAEAEAALRRELPQDITLVTLAPNQEKKNPDGTWAETYAATVVSETAHYWVPVADLEAADLTKRLDEIPSPERAWARRHLKDLVLTQDQAPGRHYLFDRKKPLAAVDPGTAFPFVWQVVATEQPGGAWQFIPTAPLPFAQPPPDEAAQASRVVLRTEPELQQAQVFSEERWKRFVDRLKHIEREARTNYRQVLANAPAVGKKPSVFRAGSGGPTTMAEGAGIGGAGGALGGAMFGGGEGAAIGAGIGALLGATGGGIFSHHRQEELYRERQAERRRYERAAAAAKERAREQLLSEYGEELQQEAEQRLSQLAGPVQVPSGPLAGPQGAMPDGYGPPPMPGLPQPYGPPSPPTPQQPPSVPPFGNGPQQPPSGGFPPPPPPN